MKTSGIITLITDFGLSDPYVAMMKGVILSINPAARLVDISHQIRFGSVIQGASLIGETFPFFPRGTVHMVVIDPTVGSKRRPIGLEAAGHLFVGPDNGIFWPVIEDHKEIKTIHLTESRYFLPHITHTFHGRDIFAPAAAHLSKGVDPAQMGDVINDPVKLEIPAPLQKEEVLTGQVMRIDHFGNLITNIRGKDLGMFVRRGRPVISVGNLTVEGLRKTYSSVAKGAALALIGSSGFLEISVNQGRACDSVGLDRETITGGRVRVTMS